MPSLADLRIKYSLEGGKYEPKPGCKFCGGSGERFIAKLNRLTFCICLFVSPEMSDFAGDSLANVAKQIRKNMEGGAE